ncbi:DUF421 domain-containing protein [Peribacillus sp. SCS-37]|uniref:DUF421 domain-containing protein n=1 Tax=Paraperibacillus esterisolvens TaxID=3115296 RepID=UPI003905C2EE
MLDFYQDQEALTTIEWILRAVVAFVFLVLVARILGQRAISQLRLLDFVIALVIGNIIAHPLSDQHLGLKGSVTTTIVLVALYLSGILLILKWPWFRNLVNHKPVTVVKNGRILYEGLKKARITIDVLLEELRQDKIADVKKVALATWEAGGKLSVFLDPKYEPLTPALSGIKTEPFFLPRTIIKEGRIIPDVLKEIQKDTDWVITTLKGRYGTEVEKVLLATVDRDDSLKVFLYK